MTNGAYQAYPQPEPSKREGIWDAAAIAVILVLAIIFGWIAFSPAVEKEAQGESLPKPRVEIERANVETVAAERPIYLPPPPAAVEIAVEDVVEPETPAAEIPQHVETPALTEATIEEPVVPVPAQSAPQKIEQATSEPRPADSDIQSELPDVPEKPMDVAQAVEEPTEASFQIPVTRATVQDGRVRLRLLEKGKGPSMEIAWPETSMEREALYDVFVQCLAMRPALLVGEERLYGLDGAPGQALRIAPDRVSFFLRRPEGRMASGERDALARIRTRHSLREGTPVRLMNRSVDAAILGGIAMILGQEFDSARTIRARYVLSGRTILIRDISADGQVYATDVAISTGMLRRC